MQISLALQVVAIATLLLAGCATIEQGSDTDEAPNERLPITAAPPAAAKYGTVCYSVRVQKDLESLSGCQSQGWEERELQALRYGEFVFPMSEADLRELYENAWDERGFLREMAIEKIYETWLTLGKEVSRGGRVTLRGLIESFLVTNLFDNLMDGGEFADVPEVHYWARFCANTTAHDCQQSATAALWEVNTAQIVFLPDAP